MSNEGRVILAILAVVLGLLPMTACSEWDTDSIGSSFYPANSQVRAFTHQVYVEYTAEKVSVWGPALNEVTASTQGHHVELHNTSDSLALIVYGYPASHDTLATTDGSLTVHSAKPYALYLSGLSLRSQQEPALQSLEGGTCHVVLPKKGVNTVYGGMAFSGELNFTGAGNLTVWSQQHALQAASLRCQYGVSVTLHSQQGDGIHLQGPMQSSLGTWTIHAAQNGVSTPDSIVLIAGTYQGSAAEGAFFDAPDGVIYRKPRLMAVSSWSNSMLDSAYVSMRYDSVQQVWQQQIDTLALQADSTYEYRNLTGKSSSGRFSSRRDIPQPWILISDGNVAPSDTLTFALKPAKK